MVFLYFFLFLGPIWGCSRFLLALHSEIGSQRCWGTMWGGGMETIVLQAASQPTLQLQREAS